MAEIEQGDPDAVVRRQRWVRNISPLALRGAVLVLVNEYEQRLGLPKRATRDLIHIAFAVSYEADYLRTWNCLHIANGEVILRLRSANEELGRWTPLILTPEELLEPI